MADDRPQGYPPILLDLDYSGQPAQQLSQTTAVTDGLLVVRGGGANTVAGHPLSADAYRDTVVDASLSVVEGDENDLAGLFVRQSAERRYVVVAVSPSGYVYVATVDGQGTPVAEGPLTPEIPFERGLGAWNRLTLVCFGPSIVVLLNRSILAHLAVDQSYAAGHAGFFLQQGATSTDARAALRWAQVRAVLADQEHG